MEGGGYGGTYEDFTLLAIAVLRGETAACHFCECFFLMVKL